MLQDSDRKVLSLFTGAGGLDLGLEAAGFRTALCVENDLDAIETIKRNRPHWRLSEPNDATIFARDPHVALERARINPGKLTLLAGGPPCQPFSKAGFWKQNGPSRMRDPRASTIHAYLKIVEALLPEVLLFENVSAFAYRGKTEGVDLLLSRIAEINRKRKTCYKPQLLPINAADYGVPQLRHRIFLIAHREGRQLSLPAPSHGPNSRNESSYVTAWDAIGEMADRNPAEDLEVRGKWADLLPSIPEGQNYLWHTPQSGGTPLFGWRTRYWSFLLKLAKTSPAWTIPANPGPATGPFHWNNRLLSVAELGRLQTFPENYEIFGNRRSQQRQLGNAVPCAVGELLGNEIRRQLLAENGVSRTLRMIPRTTGTAPAPERRRRVPKRYLVHKGSHRPHPGVGRGPQGYMRQLRVHRR